MVLKGRKILVGVSGGIAAYKAAELVRLLVKAGAEVRCLMTPSAQKFITPLTLRTLSKNPVGTDVFDLERSPVEHVELAEWAELLVVAPATANLIARLALGLADDMVSTVALACRAPLLIAPAMDLEMWRHAAVQNNLRTLVERGALTVGPAAGELASGLVGPGRMSEPAEILAACERALAPRDFDGIGVLVTAGPTWEPIDPVRFVGNRSTGKMGFAVARAAARRGAQVTLVAGPTALATPERVTRVDVETAAQMREAVLARLDGAKLVVMSAAVADWKPREVAPQKMKKALGGAPVIALDENPDILAELGARAERPALVGFAAETENVEENAAAKLSKKKCDLIVANDVSEAGSGFGTETNRVLLVSAEGVEKLPMMGKDEVAEKILDRARGLIK